MSESFRPGRRATQSGIYRVIDSTGTVVVEERAITAGRRFPPTPGRDQRYELVRAVTTVRSADALVRVTETLRGVLTRLATK